MAQIPQTIQGELVCMCWHEIVATALDHENQITTSEVINYLVIATIEICPRSETS